MKSTAIASRNLMQSDGKRAKTLWSLRGWIIFAIVVAASAIIWINASDPEQPTFEPTAVAPMPAVFGPGAWINTPSRPPIEENFSGPAIAPTVDAGGHLIIDSALQEVIEFFILERPGGNGMQALQRYLESRLPPAANSDAWQVAQRYSSYMTQHDSQIAAQSFSRMAPGSDISRIATWIQMRSRLRREVLGDTITQAWFQNEDAQLSQALLEYGQRATEYRQISEAERLNNSAGDMTPLPQWSNPEEARQHAQYLAGVILRATQSFSDRGSEHRELSNRYNAYAAAIERIDTKLAPDSAERYTQMRTLREKYFHTEAEKLFAQERWQATHSLLN